MNPQRDPSTVPSRPHWDLLSTHVPGWALGLEGSWNQLELVEQALALAGEHPGLLRPARELLRWAWQQNPLDPAILSSLRQLDTSIPFLDPGLRQLLPMIEAASQGHGRENEWPEVRDNGDPGDIYLFCRDRVAREHEWATWLSRAWPLLGEAGYWEPMADLLARCPWDQHTIRVRQRLASEIVFHSKAPGDILSMLAGQEPAPFEEWRDMMLAECMLRLGDWDHARDIFFALARSMDWHTNLILKLAALLDPVPPWTRVPEETSVAVLVYTWNNVEKLELTLPQLLSTELGQARVVVLDNGSTDNTSEFLASLDTSLFPNLSEIVSLPVNIGAPAARNWLLSLPQVRKCGYVAFVDDDAVPDRLWLPRLLSTLRTYPQCGSAGCRVLDADTPQALQAVDVHLLPPRQNKPFRFRDSATSLLDNGLQALVRPCLSVTGCCHVLSRDTLSKHGGFDIRFSPSQLDDFERDLRAMLAGSPCVYNGTVAVKHSKSGGSVHNSASKLANVLGNTAKLEHLYSPQEVREAVERDYSLAWDDLVAKAALVMETLNE